MQPVLMFSQIEKWLNPLVNPWGNLREPRIAKLNSIELLEKPRLLGLLKSHLQCTDKNVERDNCESIPTVRTSNVLGQKTPNVLCLNATLMLYWSAVWSEKGTRMKTKQNCK